MFAGITSRVFKPQAGVIGVRQQVAVRTDGMVSQRLARLVALILGIALLIVFAFSQLMHWHIASTVTRLDQLQSARNEYGSEKMRLLAARAQLTSREYVTELAGRKFQLHAPQKGQVRSL